MVYESEGETKLLEKTGAAAQNSHLPCSLLPRPLSLICKQLGGYLKHGIILMQISNCQQAQQLKWNKGREICSVVLLAECP